MSDLPDTKGILEGKLAALEAFMASPAYKDIIFTFRTDIETYQAGILHSAPITTEDVARINQLFGKLEVITSQMTIFEEYRASLKEKLADLS